MHGARPLRSTRRLANMTGQRPGWYRITNSASGGPTQVTIYDEIGFYGVSAADFLADLRQVQGDIELHLNSPGGDVFDGIAIYNVLRQSGGNVRVVVDGLAASAASFIAQAAAPGLLEMAPHSQMMIHDGFAIGIGSAADMRDLAGQLDMASDNIASIYAERSGKPVDHWRALMKAETWFTDQGAVDAGLADKIHGQDAPESSWDLSVFSNTACGSCGGRHPREWEQHGCGPQNAAPAPAEPPAEPADDGMHGDHKRVDPDGDGDCDACASGDTDHDYWTEDGQQIQPLPGEYGIPGNKAPLFPILNADVDGSAWDASKAWHNGAESDDPAAFYRGICAGRKAGDPSTQDAWALPYKYHPGDAPNAAGVRAALSRLPQTEGLTNAAEARATLEKAMKAVNPDYSPDDHIDTELLAAVFSLALEGAEA